MTEKVKNDGERMIDATGLMFDLDIEKILLGTFSRSLSANEISELYGIPLLTCIRKIRKLEVMGLLKKVAVVESPRGKKRDFYTASLENAYVFYDDGKLKVRFNVVLQMASDLRKRVGQLGYSTIYYKNIANKKNHL